jgi:putative heme iron utilization protein
MKAWDSKTVEYFYLTKDELVSEIRQRAVTPNGKDKHGNDKFYTALGSSQGSGKIKGDNVARLQILQENLDQKRQDQIGWDFNAKTEPELYKSWQAKYLKTTAQLKEIFKEMSIDV